MTWTKLVESLSLLFNSYVKKYAVSFVLKTIGVTGGIWAKVVSFLLTKVFIYAKKQADQAALIADQAKKDKEILEKYKEAIKNNASEQELIDLEEDLLNGGRK